MRHLKYIFICFSLTLSIRCNNKVDEVIATDIKHDFTGDWICSFPFNTRELVLKSDSTFKYHDQSCLGHGYSEGNWKSDDSGVLLLSFEKYSKNPRFVITKRVTKNSPMVFKKIKSKGVSMYTSDPAGYNTTVTLKYSNPDTDYIYFENVRLKIYGDTLYHLDDNGFTTDTKYVLSSKLTQEY